MRTATIKYTANGDILSTNANYCWGKIQEHLNQLAAEGLLELDLRASRMIDSVGLNVIVKTIKTAENKGGKVRLLLGSESLKRICTFTRLDRKAEIVGP